LAFRFALSICQNTGVLSRNLFDIVLVAHCAGRHSQLDCDLDAQVCLQQEAKRLANNDHSERQFEQVLAYNVSNKRGRVDVEEHVAESTSHHISHVTSQLQEFAEKDERNERHRETCEHIDSASSDQIQASSSSLTTSHSTTATTTSAKLEFAINRAERLLANNKQHKGTAKKAHTKADAK